MRVRSNSVEDISSALTFLRQEYNELVAAARRTLPSSPPRDAGPGDVYTSGGKIYVYGSDGWDTYSKD